MNYMNRRREAMGTDPFKDSLYVTVVRAEDLPVNESKELCNPYVKLFLLPRHSGSRKRKTKVKHKTLNPIYDEIFKFTEINRDQISKLALEVTVWDYDRFSSNEFLGEVLIDLCDADLSAKAYWYPLYKQTSALDSNLQPSPTAAVKRLVSQFKPSARGPSRKWTTFGNKSISIDTSSDNTSLCEMQVLTNAESDSDISYRTMRYLHSTSCDSAGTSSYWYSRSSVDSRLSVSRSSWSPSIDSNYTSYGTSRYDSRSTSLDSRMSLGSIMFYSGEVEDEEESFNVGGRSASSSTSLKQNLQRHLQYSQFGIKDKNLPVTGSVQVRLQHDGDQLMVTAISARGLIPRDKMGSAEPYLKLYLHPDRSKRKTRVMTRTLNPEWNQQFVFPGVVSSELKNHYLEIIALHYDRFSCSSFMGQAIVYLTADVCDGIARWHDLSDFKSSRDLLTPLYSGKIGSGHVSKSTSYLPSSPKPQILQRPCYSESKLKLLAEHSPRLGHRLSKSFDPLPDFSKPARRFSVSSQGSLHIRPYCSQGSLVPQAFDVSELLQSSNIVMSHQPLEPILSAQSVESSQENSLKHLDDSGSYDDRKSNDGAGKGTQGDDIMLSPTSSKSSSHPKPFSPIDRIRKLFTPRLGRKEMKLTSSSVIIKSDTQLDAIPGSSASVGGVATCREPPILPSKISLLPRKKLGLLHKDLSQETTDEPQDITGVQDRRSTKSSIESDMVRMTTRPPPEGHDKGYVLDVIGIGPGQNPGLWSPPEQQVPGDVQVSLEQCEGLLQVTILKARHLKHKHDRNLDAYIKAHLLDGRKKMQKKKTKTIRSTVAPVFNETFEFTNGFSSLTLVLTVTSRESFGRKVALGEAQINLSSLDLTVRLTAWYRLFYSHPLQLLSVKR